MTQITYTLIVTENGTETIRIEGKDFEFCQSRAESIARVYGMYNPVNYRDGTVFIRGEDTIKIVSSNGLSAEDEAISWTCTPEEIEILKRDGAFAVIRHREAQVRAEKAKNIFAPRPPFTTMFKPLVGEEFKEWLKTNPFFKK